MTLRRGFLAEANKYALEFRKELQVAPHAPLCPQQLAKHLEIPVLPISQLENLDEKYHAFFKSDKCPLSAAALPISGSVRGIVYNDHHSEKRQSSSIAHEISHIILRHDTAQIMHADGTRNFNSALEEEASNLGAILLVPDKAALYILLENIPTPKACNDYKVSRHLMEWRLNRSGARQIVAHSHKKTHPEVTE